MKQVSFQKAQAEVLIDLNNFGQSKSEFSVFQSGGVAESFLLQQAAQLTIEANQNLIAADRVATGKLADSIAPKEPVREGNSIYVDIELLEYYRYVDRGAKYTTKGPPIGPIKEWLRVEGSKQRNNPYRPISRREAKRSLKPTKPMTLDQRAFMVSRAIKEKGLKPTLFWTKAIQKIEKNIQVTIGEAVKVEVVNSLR